ncbi:MAG TPA: LamG domain-containing protein, partial [bacterium]|nr:LamG domain-containing protein [bacterium]
MKKLILAVIVFISFVSCSNSIDTGRAPAEEKVIMHTKSVAAYDHGGNYGGGWTDGSNGGTGFGPWSITVNAGTGFAGNFIGDPAVADISGMSSESFALYANPDGSGALVDASRAFNAPLSTGDTFSFQWGVNWDSNGAGEKGFVLMSGATTLITIKMGGTGTITINGTDMFVNYGVNAMTLNFQLVSATELRVFATGRDGSETYDENITISSAPDAFRFYAANLADGDSKRQPYFNNLTIKNLPVPQPDNALSFDGADDHITVPHDSSLNFTEFTVEMWINKSETKDLKLMGKSLSYSHQKGFVMGITNQDKLFIETWNSGSVFTQGTSTMTIPNGQWVHLVMTWKSGDRLKGYINGQNVIDVATADYDITTTNALIIGMAPWNDLNENHFKGKIDEVRIWNDIRTETEIRQNMYRELPDAASETNLVAYYKFNETSGTILEDSKGNNHGELKNMAGDEWTPSLAKFGPKQALSFDGTDDYVSFASGNSPAYNNTSMTVEAWINSSSTNTEEEILGWGSEVDSNVVEFRMSSGKLEFGMDVSGWQSVTGNKNINDGEWNHVSFVKNGNSVSLYVNGILDSQGTVTFSPSVTVMTIGNLYQNGSHQSGRYEFPGKIDEVRIWNTARTASEIRENMTRNLTGNETGLIAYYNFDNTSGTILQDFSGNGNDGTLTNMDDADWVDSEAYNTWFGAAGSDWSEALNWSDGVPASTDNVGIYKWSGNSEVSISGTPEINNLVISSTAAPTLDSDITVNGNFINAGGTLNGGASTVFLGGISQAIAGNTSFYNLSKTVLSSDALTFESGSTTTVTGTLTLKGADGQILSLRSDVNGTRWNIDPQNIRNIDYVDVKDSENINENTINVINFTDSGNNIKWALQTYTLTYTAGANGSITGTSPQTVNHGSDGSEVTATPDAGYSFVKWNDDVLTASRTDTNVTADITVEAEFADVNECETDNGGCAQNCNNTPGSFNCTCDAGYTLNVDGFNCDDVNECETDNGGCAQNCNNTP